MGYEEVDPVFGTLEEVDAIYKRKPRTPYVYAESKEGSNCKEKRLPHGATDA